MMQCFICVTYMIMLCSATPSYSREIATVHEKRSLFRDVIESLRLHAHLPEDFNQNEVNNLSGNDDRFNYASEPDHLPADVEYIPRRNDRVELPPLNYRLPKTIGFNENEEKIAENQRQEVVVYIDTDKVKTTQKPKKSKRPTPRPLKIKYPNRDNDEDTTADEDSEPADNNNPFSNTMAGQSQIGNRESQTVIKPTVIVNIRGSVNHKDSDIRLQRKQDNKTTSEMIPQNVFNINQEIKVQRDVDAKKAPKFDEKVKSTENTSEKNNMLICDTATRKTDTVEDIRKFDNVFQILFTI